MPADFKDIYEKIAAHFDAASAALLRGDAPPLFAGSMGVDAGDVEASIAEMLDREELAESIASMASSGSARMGEWVGAAAESHAIAALDRDWSLRRMTRLQSYAAAHREAAHRSASPSSISQTIAQIKESK